ncbi:MAG TPA: sigma-70 family RNA polymerase sigma factor [Actinomycetota bacterium]
MSVAFAEMTDSQLVAAATDGDSRAFDELYGRYWGDVRGYCRRFLNDPMRVDDLAQETFLRALKHLPRFKPGQRLWPWLMVIARNVCIDELRLRQTAHLSTDADDEFPEEETLPVLIEDTVAEEIVRREECAELRRTLARGFAALTPRDRRIIWLHTVEEWDWDSIAEADRSTSNSVRNAAWRARRYLKTVVEEGRSPFALFPGLHALKRLASRMRYRMTDVSSRLSSISDARLASDQVAAVMVGFGLVVASFGLAADGTPPELVEPAAPFSYERPAGAESWLDDHDGESNPPVDVASRQPATAPSDEPDLPFYTETDHNPGAVGPKRGKLVIDVKDPDGNSLLYSEDEYTCAHDESAILPTEGPITAYC